MSPSDRVAQLCPQAPGSLYVTFYGSKGYGGGILIRLNTEFVLFIGIYEYNKVLAIF
jgi:hypothetical protein